MSNITAFLSLEPPRPLPPKVKIGAMFLCCPTATKILSTIVVFVLFLATFITWHTKEIEDWILTISGSLLFASPFWFCLMAYCIVKANKINKLLQDGILSSAKLKSKEQTNIIITGEGTVYKMTLEFKTTGKVPFETVVKTANPRIIAKLSGKEEKPLLYDPAKPSHVLLVDAMPELMKIKKSGRAEVNVSNIKILWMALVWLFLVTGTIAGTICVLPKFFT